MPNEIEWEVVIPTRNQQKDEPKNRTPPPYAPPPPKPPVPKLDKNGMMQVSTNADLEYQKVDATIKTPAFALSEAEANYLHENGFLSLPHYYKRAIEAKQAAHLGVSVNAFLKAKRVEGTPLPLGYGRRTMQSLFAIFRTFERGATPQKTLRKRKAQNSAKGTKKH